MPSPQSRLYLKLTDTEGGGNSIACVEAALQAGDVAALLVRTGTDTAPKTGIKGLLAVAHAHDVALIIDRNVELAAALGADGVEVDASLADYTSARAALGEGAIVGAAPGRNRHAAMELAEAGAAYVGFEDDPSDPESMSVWWAEVMEVPCVAHVAGRDGEVLSAAAAGIEFISPDETLWQSPEHAAETVKHLNDLIAKAGLAP